MRFVLAAIAVAVLAISVSSSTTTYAQKKKQMTLNECIDLAISRGHTRASVDQSGAGGRSSPARRFVIRCLQGKQR